MIYNTKNNIFANNMHLKNDKKCTIHTDWGGYIHLLGRWGAYINELN